jgi:hypothetical protein
MKLVTVMIVTVIFAGVRAAAKAVFSQAARSRAWRPQQGALASGLDIA